MPDEKELGVAIIDLGGGTTDLVIFSNGAIKHTAVVALAGNHITNDISMGLRTPLEEAEKIKKRYGCALTSLVQKDETIEVPSVGGRNPRVLSRQTLAEIVEPRVEEILTLVHHEVMKTGYANLIASGIILTGAPLCWKDCPSSPSRFSTSRPRGLPSDRRIVTGA
jgi:cell division protein FtsA